MSIDFNAFILFSSIFLHLFNYYCFLKKLLQWKFKNNFIIFSLKTKFKKFFYQKYNNSLRKIKLSKLLKKT